MLVLLSYVLPLDFPFLLQGIEAFLVCDLGLTLPNCLHLSDLVEVLGGAADLILEPEYDRSLLTHQALSML